MVAMLRGTLLLLEGLPEDSLGEAAHIKGTATLKQHSHLL